MSKAEERGGNYHCLQECWLSQLAKKWVGTGFLSCADAPTNVKTHEWLTCPPVLLLPIIASSLNSVRAVWVRCIRPRTPNWAGRSR
jgi:hypothetical protein